jgi:very-short-patch-repair endonuclease
MRHALNNRVDLKPRRRALRSTLTSPEARLWSCLQRSQLGCKFRRQHSLGPFILDFYCPSKRIAIELDGAAHDSERAWHYDEARSQYLRANGITVIRFLNEDVVRNLEGVLLGIRAVL